MIDRAQILALNAFDPAHAVGLGAELAESVRQRANLFGAASVLFYDKPLNFVRGEGCWLYEADGTAYLDAYNNVPSVGHCHPHVAEAAARQLRELNIHNRYLHQGIIEYAERLTATLPGTLSNITFTCTGSESNDLALRLAATFTGARGLIVTESAYHGNTALVTEVSPTLNKHEASAPFVRLIPAPDSYRVPPEKLSETFAGHVTAAIADQSRDQKRPEDSDVITAQHAKKVRSGPSSHILLVEDNAVNQRVARRILEKYKLRVSSIASPIFKTDWPGAPTSSFSPKRDQFGANFTFDQQDELLERGFVRCRDAGNVILHIVLKNS